jgi:hypothetical protein
MKRFKWAAEIKALAVRVDQEPDPTKMGVLMGQ